MNRERISRARDLAHLWVSDRCLFIWGVAILAVVLRVALSFAFKTYQFDPAQDHFDFGFEWARIAKWLVINGSFSLNGQVPTADTDPLYSLFIAPFFYVFGVYTSGAAIALIFFQSLICGLSVWGIFVLAEKLYGSFEARLSALLFAVYPPSIFFAVSRIGPASVSILILCLLFLVVLAIPLASRFQVALTLWGGFLMGLLVLSSSDNLSILLVVPLWLVVTGAPRRRMGWLGLAAVGAALIVILPWSIRNSLVLEEPTISKANLGFHLWVGNNPYATGFLFTSMPPDRPRNFGRPQQADYYKMAISWIVEHPKQFAWLTLKRFKYFWYVIEGRGNSTPEILYGCLLLTLLGLAVAGAIWSGKKFTNASLLMAFVVVYPLVFYFTHASFYRHRYHVEPFLLILASHGLYCLWTAFANRQFSETRGTVRTIETPLGVEYPAESVGSSLGHDVRLLKRRNLLLVDNDSKDS